MRNIFKRNNVEESHRTPVNEGTALDVLVVESDPKFLLHLNNMVRTARLPDSNSYLAIDSAGSLREAIDKISERRYDIILTDVNLADASGFLVLEELVEFGNHTPIIVLSNITNWSMIIQSAQAGISDFLLKKTLDPDLLIRSIFYAIERNKLELKVNRTEDSYRSLIEILPVGLFRTDAKGSFSYANRVFADMVGLPLKAIEGKFFKDIIAEESTEKFQLALEKILQENTPVEIEIPLHRKDEAPLNLLCIGTPMHDDLGKVEGVQGVLVDTTSQKQMQAEKHASETLGSLQSGLSKMANELNNAMGSILLDSENLRDSDRSDISKEAIERIEGAVHKARSVLRPFLVSAEEVGPRSELLDPYKILKPIFEEIKASLPAHLQIESRIPEHLESIEGDASLLGKMLFNVLHNAVESMPDKGTVSLSASMDNLGSESDVCDLLGLLPGKYLHLTISDQGSGILPHMTQRVFEPFYTSKEKPHAGVGLTETLGIVKSHKGNVRLESYPGKGTHFHIYLPISERKINTAAKRETDAPTRQPGDRKTILLVDDETNILMSANMLLRRFGYEVITATNGAEALTKFSEHQSEIGLVITDYAMPVMDGPALIHALRKMSPSTKIVLCTGLEMQSSMKGLSALDLDGTLFKPFTAVTLSEMVSKHFEK